MNKLTERKEAIKNRSQLENRSLTRAAEKVVRYEVDVERIMAGNIPRESAELIINPRLGGGTRGFKSEHSQFFKLNLFFEL